MSKCFGYQTGETKCKYEYLWQADLVISLILQEIWDDFSKIISLLGFDDSLQTLRVEHGL